MSWLVLVGLWGCGENASSPDFRAMAAESHGMPGISGTLVVQTLKNGAPALCRRGDRRTLEDNVVYGEDALGLEVVQPGGDFDTHCMIEAGYLESRTVQVKRYRCSRRDQSSVQSGPLETRDAQWDVIAAERLEEAPWLAEEVRVVTGELRPFLVASTPGQPRYAVAYEKLGKQTLSQPISGSGRRLKFQTTYEETALGDCVARSFDKPEEHEVEFRYALRKGQWKRTR